VVSGRRFVDGCSCSWLAKINRSGGVIWSKTYSHGDKVVPSTVLSVTESYGDGYFAAVEVGEGERSLVMKIDDEGDSLWNSTTVSEPGYVPNSVARADGGYAVVHSNEVNPGTGTVVVSYQEAPENDDGGSPMPGFTVMSFVFGVVGLLIYSRYR
jgi:hypothetical protein